MHMRPLRFFAAIVDYGGIGKAAERLNISQPAMSAALKVLEQELGVELFDRRSGRRGLRLTEEGLHFYQYVVKILRDYDQAKSELRDMPAPRQRLRVGVLETMPPMVVRASLFALAESHPEYRVELWEGSPSRLADWLSQGRLDVAWSLVEEGEEQVRVLWQEPFVLALSHKHRLASSNGASVGLEAIGDYPFVFRTRCEMAGAMRVYLRSAGVTPQILMRVEREDLAFSFVAKGVGITLSPFSLVPDDLLAAKVDGLSLQRTIGLRRRQGALADGMDATEAAIRTGAADMLKSLETFVAKPEEPGSQPLPYRD